MTRRELLKALCWTTAGWSPGLGRPNVRENDDSFRLTFLQTNDTHSRIDPFPPDSGRNAGLGGSARRATLVKQVRRENPHPLMQQPEVVLGSKGRPAAVFQVGYGGA